MKMPETFVPGLKTKEARKALAAAVITMFDRWELPQAKQAALLGLSDISSIRQGKPLPDDFDVLTRAGHLLAIDRALKEYYGENTAQRDAWLMYTYSELGGQSPLALMLTGVEGINRVRKLFDAHLETDHEN
jgi:hypothetical protein